MPDEPNAAAAAKAAGPDEPNAAALAKAAGTAAFQSGKFEEAVLQFSAAIAADPTNHVLFSNRSAAYAKQALYTQALLDANKCIDLAPTWAKGHSRRGAAYVGLRNWRQTIVAYEDGLKLEPENAVMKEALASIQLKLSGGGPSAVGGRGPPPGMPVVPGAGGTAALALLFLAASVFYFLPLLAVGTRALIYQIAMGSALAAYATSLWRTWPKTMSTIRDARFLQSREVQSIPLMFALLLSPPMPMALVSFGVYALHRAIRLLADTAVPRLPGFLRERAVWLLTEEGTHTALAFAAISDLMLALTAPLTLLTHGLRAGLLCMMCIQDVFKSYHTSWYAIYYYYPLASWPSHDIDMPNSVCCIAYTREVGRGVVYCPIIKQ